MAQGSSMPQAPKAIDQLLMPHPPRMAPLKCGGSSAILFAKKYHLVEVSVIYLAQTISRPAEYVNRMKYS